MVDVVLQEYSDPVEEQTVGIELVEKDEGKAKDKPELSPVLGLRQYPRRQSARLRNRRRRSRRPSADDVRPDSA